MSSQDVISHQFCIVSTAHHETRPVTEQEQSNSSSLAGWMSAREEVYRSRAERVKSVCLKYYSLGHPVVDLQGNSSVVVLVALKRLYRILSSIAGPDSFSTNPFSLLDQNSPPNSLELDQERSVID